MRLGSRASRSMMRNFGMASNRFFFFQAEDGIRDKLVTGVQTCALPISVGSLLAAWLSHGRIALFPTLVGAFFLAVFALDLGFATYSVTAPPGAGVTQVFSSDRKSVV